MNETLALSAVAAAALLTLAPKAVRRLQLSMAKHPSLTGHSRMAQRVARLLPGYAYDAERFFGCDDAPAEVQAQRRQGFAALAQRLGEQHARSIAWTDALRPGLSDLQFTSQYRVPFQFSPYLRQRIKLGNVGVATQGVTLTDLDGQVYDDLTGSYGVNLFGHDVYKRLIAQGSAQVADYGPVLGTLHPCVASNVDRKSVV